MKHFFQIFTRSLGCILFFLNAQIHKAQVIQETKSENGLMNTRYKVRDSTALHPDKDNHLCLYGMRNAADEWVIPPQYDNIEMIRLDYHHIENYYIVTKNEKCGVLNEHGKIMIPIEWDALWQLSQEDTPVAFNEGRGAALPTPQIGLRALKNKQMGVIDLQNNLILKPNYEYIDKCKKDLFIIRNQDGYGIVDKNGSILVFSKHYRLEFTSFDDIFMTMGPDFFDDHFQKRVRKHGLIHRSGQVLLPTQFINLKSRGNRYYLAQQYIWEEDAGRGLFHVDKGWMLDTMIHILPFNGIQQVPNYLLSQKVWTKPNPNKPIIRYGVFSEIDHQLLLGFDYESIQYFQTTKYNSDTTNVLPKDISQKQPYFLCQKQGLYGVFDPIRRAWTIPIAYDGLQPFGDSLFLVLKQGKWRCINAQAQWAMTDIFDEVIVNVNKQHSPVVINQFYAQKKDSLYGFDSRYFPHSSHLYDPIQHYINTRKFITWQGDMIVTDSDKKVIVSTQDRIISQDNDFFIVENKITKIRQVIDYQGNRKPFYSKYKVQNIQGKANVLLVCDTTTHLLGATTLDGKEILPCQFWGMTPADMHERIWVKKEGIRLNPKMILPDLNSLKKEQNRDNRFKGCQMYDKKGQLLSPIFFDYPIEWQAYLKVGIGQVADKQGLWHAQGKMILPPQYDKIVYDEVSKMYYLFQAQNSKEMAINFANDEGQIVINTFFKNMSFFYGNYALVETDAGYGMIQKNGQYWITPSPFALQQPDKSILDTLMMYPQSDFTMPFESESEAAVALKQWQDLKSAKKHIPIGNLIVEQLIQQYFLKKDAFEDRHSHRIFILNQEPYLLAQRSNPNYVQKELTIPLMGFTSNNLHFLLETRISQPHSQYGRQPFNRYLSFKNFKFYNNIWMECNINDILICNEKTLNELNALLIQKIGALKNMSIDCNNPEKYWEIVQNRFFILPEGLVFYFPKYANSELSYPETERIPILMTWAELKPYLLK